MDLKEFDKKFDIAVKNFNSNVLNLENIQKRVDEYCDENGKMDLYSVVGYLSNESKVYMVNFTYDLLRDLLVEEDTSEESSSDLTVLGWLIFNSNLR